MKSKEVQKEFIKNIKKWKEIENSTILATENIARNTDNSLIKMVMEIIKRDSQMHYKVQEFIQESIEKSVVSISPDELSKVWHLIDKHIELEKDTIAIGKVLTSMFHGKELPVQQYLVDYLLVDEKKHDLMLMNLEKLKKGMYP